MAYILLHLQFCGDTAGLLHKTMHGDVWAGSAAEAHDSGKLHPCGFKAHSLEQDEQMIESGDTIFGCHTAYCVSQNALSQLCTLCSG